jgi:hypothetical protein
VKQFMQVIGIPISLWALIRMRIVIQQGSIAASSIRSKESPMETVYVMIGIESIRQEAKF